MWRMVDRVVLMAANVDRGGLLGSAMTYCLGRRKVLLDTSRAAHVVCVPPEEVPCAPPDVPPDVCMCYIAQMCLNQVEHLYKLCSKRQSL